MKQSIIVTLLLGTLIGQMQAESIHVFNQDDNADVYIALYKNIPEGFKRISPVQQLTISTTWVRPKLEKDESLYLFFSQEKDDLPEQLTTDDTVVKKSSYFKLEPQTQYLFFGADDYIIIDKNKAERVSKEDYFSRLPEPASGGRVYAGATKKRGRRGIEAYGKSGW